MKLTAGLAAIVALANVYTSAMEETRGSEVGDGKQPADDLKVLTDENVAYLRSALGQLPRKEASNLTAVIVALDEIVYHGNWAVQRDGDGRTLNGTHLAEQFRRLGQLLVGMLNLEEIDIQEQRHDDDDNLGEYLFYSLVRQHANNCAPTNISAVIVFALSLLACHVFL